MKTVKDLFDLLGQEVDKFGFSIRVINNCRHLKIQTVFELMAKLATLDSSFTNIFGQVSIEEVKNKLLAEGINVKNFYPAPDAEKHFNLGRAIFAYPIHKN